MPTLHIIQGDDRYWMLTITHDDGKTHVLAYRFASQKHVVELAEVVAGRLKLKVPTVNETKPATPVTIIRAPRGPARKAGNS